MSRRRRHRARPARIQRAREPRTLEQMDGVMVALRTPLIPQILGAARIPMYYGWWLGEQAAIAVVTRARMLEAGLLLPDQHGQIVMPK